MEETTSFLFNHLCYYQSLLEAHLLQGSFRPPTYAAMDIKEEADPREHSPEDAEEEETRGEKEKGPRH